VCVRRLVLPSHQCLTPHSWGTPWDMNATYILLKSTFNGLQFRRWQYGSIFVRLAVIASKTREMSRNSKRIWPYSGSRSSKVIDLGVIGKPICDFLLVLNCNFSLSLSRYWRLKIKNDDFTHPSSVWRPRSGNPLEFLDETYPAKTRGMGLPYGENIIIV